MQEQDKRYRSEIQRWFHGNSYFTYYKYILYSCASAAWLYEEHRNTENHNGIELLWFFAVTNKIYRKGYETKKCSFIRVKIRILTEEKRLWKLL